VTTARPVTTAGIVLAGGASTRFGADKLSVPLHGRPLLHHALEAVARVGDPLVLVVGPNAVAPVLPDGLGVRVQLVRDRQAHHGPLAGVAGALAALPPGVDRVIVVAGDMPFLVPAVLASLLDALGRDGQVQAARLEADPVSPLPFAALPAVREVADHQLAAGRRSLRALLDAVATAVVPASSWRALDPEGRTLRDIDAPEDLARS
jgi:molybdopterin-guanine dinucleotide biosynthesis protein A